jgi:hypothetical protein
VPIVLKSESLNLLEPYGPVQACNGIALAYEVKYKNPKKKKKKKKHNFHLKK